MWAAAGETIELGSTETCQNWEVSLRVFVIYLDQAADEKVLLLWGPSLPVVRFSNGDCKANFAGPPLALGLFFVCWN